MRGNLSELGPRVGVVGSLHELTPEACSLLFLFRKS